MVKEPEDFDFFIDDYESYSRALLLIKANKSVIIPLSGSTELQRNVGL